MKKSIKKIISMMLAMVIFSTLCLGCSKDNATDDGTAETTDSKAEAVTTETGTQEVKIDNINLWYTDEVLTQYLTNCAIHFREENGVGVNLNLISSVDYVENIYQGTKEGNVADVYIINTESLEKAYLAGIAAENTQPEYTSVNYPQIALNASTYHGKLVGYPLYYDTTFFMYNKDYVEAPLTFEDIIEFANVYMGEYEGIETILQWDVHDLFFSYGFVGAYLDFGGACGDDASIINIANKEVIEALTAFKQINQSLYFDAADSNYEDVLADFLAGKILYTMGSTADLEEIIVADINYGICTLPMINEELNTKPVSINYTAVVNPYSSNKEMAAALAKGITYEHAEEFYSYVKRLPARKLSEYPNAEWQHIAEQYESSTILPKLMSTTNYWLELESMLNNIWDRQLDEETEIEIEDDTLTEDEQMQIRQAYVANIIRTFVTEDVNMLQALMEQQIN
ncbi:MAG: extracellular solute-binding protein [Lachnospiraceae bacterium]|nr:extracellular solute-binding protein [Lachnospiraceae bacterium]